MSIRKSSYATKDTKFSSSGRQGSATKSMKNTKFSICDLCDLRGRDFVSCVAVLSAEFALEWASPEGIYMGMRVKSVIVALGLFATAVWAPAAIAQRGDGAQGAAPAAQGGQAPARG